MIRSLYSSAAGMNSQQMNLDVIANNLSNVNTTGISPSRRASAHADVKTCWWPRCTPSKLPMATTAGVAARKLPMPWYRR